MNLELLRYSSGKESTLGLLFKQTDLGKKFLCYVLEDEYRSIKKVGKTRIPAGDYQLILRKEGLLHEKYNKKFPIMHNGMLWIIGLETFEYVYLHIGNTSKDTMGCPLVGDSVFQNITQNGRIEQSVAAYQRIYPEIASAIENGLLEPVYIGYQLTNEV